MSAQLSAAVATADSATTALLRCCSALGQCRETRTVAVVLDGRSRRALDSVANRLQKLVGAHMAAPGSSVGQRDSLTQAHRQCAPSFRGVAIAILAAVRLGATRVRTRKSANVDPSVVLDEFRALESSPSTASRTTGAFVNRLLRIAGFDDGGGRWRLPTAFDGGRQQTAVDRLLGDLEDNLGHIVQRTQRAEERAENQARQSGEDRATAQSVADLERRVANADLAETDLRTQVVWLTSELAGTRERLASRGADDQRLLTEVDALQESAANSSNLELEVREQSIVIETQEADLHGLRRRCDTLQGEVELAGRRLVELGVNRQAMAHDLEVSMSEVRERDERITELSQWLNQLDHYLEQSSSGGSRVQAPPQRSTSARHPAIGSRLATSMFEALE